MPIPGYDPQDIVERTLERTAPGTTARLELVASSVPDAVDIVEAESDVEAPPGALGDPVELYAVDEVEGLVACRVELPYDPSELPPGASPTDVAVAVETDDGYEFLESDTDLEETTVAATVTDAPPGSVIVPVTTHDREMPVDDSPRE
ncbi:hypothetical protein [Natronosalvus rutilus]|uniref:Uncharacterized protein n=1 Tax=Natronosalvus rutilus TaxID=2953753 RepID=A0A9E7NAV0_9EURY|nr:hypothetical protein [Natronosalvus rutilus]UTF54031.1 hypothetical protein NGM29_01720 [Natronosalvus rutilus]